MFRVINNHRDLPEAMKQRIHLTEETDSWSLAEMQWILDLHAFAQKVSILLQQCQSSCDKILILILLEIFENTAFLFRFRLSRDHSTSYSSSIASMFSVVPCNCARVCACSPFRRFRWLWPFESFSSFVGDSAFFARFPSRSFGPLFWLLGLLLIHRLGRFDCLRFGYSVLSPYWGHSTSDWRGWLTFYKISLPSRYCKKLVPRFLSDLPFCLPRLRLALSECSSALAKVGPKEPFDTFVPRQVLLGLYNQFSKVICYGSVAQRIFFHLQIVEPF
jgi:hypothetical protein